MEKSGKPSKLEPSIFSILKKPTNDQPSIFSKSEQKPSKKKSKNRVKKKPMVWLYTTLCIYSEPSRILSFLDIDKAKNSDC